MITPVMIEAIFSAIFKLAPEIIPALTDTIQKDDSLTVEEIDVLMAKLKEHKLPTWEEL